jgi:hypothetical protein
MRAQHPGVGEAIRSSGKLEQSTIDELTRGVNTYKQLFTDDQTHGRQVDADVPDAGLPGDRPTTEHATPGNPLV